MRNKTEKEWSKERVDENIDEKQEWLKERRGLVKNKQERKIARKRKENFNEEKFLREKEWLTEVGRKT